MAAPSFTLTSKDASGFALYAADTQPQAGGLCLSFLLVPTPGTDPGSALTFAESWACSGGYLFSLAPVAGEPGTLAQQLGLATAAQNQRAFLWFTPASPATSPRLAMVP